MPWITTAAILNREDDAVVQRIAFGGAVEAHAQHRAGFLDREQSGQVSGCGGGVSHGIIVSRPE
jgi:hypothetical protein